MLPVLAVRLEVGTLLADDGGLIAPPTNANEMALIAAPFTPDENLVIGDLTLATFTGSTPISCVAGTQESGIDPITGQQVVTIKPPAGGFRWACTAGTGLPQTIYGFALLSHSGAALVAMQAFDTPITITDVGDQIDIGKATITIVLSPLS